MTYRSTVKYSIKDIEKLTGIKAHTIRIWEQRYELIEPKRSETNIRYYDDEQMKFMLNVSLLLKNGYKISQVSKMNDDEFGRTIESIYDQSLIHADSPELELNANDLMVSMIDLDANKFTTIYNNSVQRNGFEKTITELIYPFMEKIGILWAIGQVHPVHEHFMSNLIRQKIISAIDHLPEGAGSPSFVLFLQQGEHHEIGLLMAWYLLKKRGHRVYYLGQNLPLADLELAVQHCSPDYALTFMVDPGLISDASGHVQELAKACASCKLLIAGQPNPSLAADIPASVSFLTKMQDLEDYTHKAV